MQNTCLNLKNMPLSKFKGIFWNFKQIFYFYVNPPGTNINCDVNPKILRGNWLCMFFLRKSTQREHANSHTNAATAKALTH